MAQRVAAKPATYDHLKSKKKPVVRKVWIALDDEVAERYETAKKNLENAEIVVRARPEHQPSVAKLAEAQAAFEEARAAMEEEAVCFRFKALGPKVYDEILTAHPATNEQVAEAKKQDPEAQPAWNGETFPRALIAACAVDPVLTPEDVDDMFDSGDWNSNELMSLFMTALEANTQRRVLELGN